MKNILGGLGEPIFFRFDIWKCNYLSQRWICDALNVINFLIFKEGVWRWERTASNFDYTNWEKGEPNNWNGAGNGAEGCLELLPNTFLWNDYSCDPSGFDGLRNKQKPMCQKFL